jgi:hypothetical protein
MLERETPSLDILSRFRLPADFLKRLPPVSVEGKASNSGNISDLGSKKSQFLWIYCFYFM